MNTIRRFRGDESAWDDALVPWEEKVEQKDAKNVFENGSRHAPRAVTQSRSCVFRRTAQGLCLLLWISSYFLSLDPL